MARSDSPTDPDESTDNQAPTAHELKDYHGLELSRPAKGTTKGILIEASVAVDSQRDTTYHNFAAPDPSGGFKTVHRSHDEVAIALRTGAELTDPQWDADDVPEWVPHPDKEGDD